MEFIKNKNYIVVFTYGAFIQRHIKLSENLELMPLKPLYEQCLVNYLSTSCRDFNVKVEGENLKELYNPFSIINNSKDVEDMLSKLFHEHPTNQKKQK